MGHVNLHARAGGTNGVYCGLLYVCVRNRKQVSYNAHFVIDSATPPHSTIRTSADLTSMTASLNSIYDKQANIVFGCGSYDSPVLSADYGNSIEIAGDDDESSEFAQHCSGAPDVFFVWDLQYWNGYFYWHVNGLYGGGVVFFPDDSSGTDETLAHELGHYLGLLPPYGDYTDWSRHNEVMYKYTWPDGYKIMHAQVDIANPD